jgi:Icc-related predicted phosphoesterase
MKTNQIFFCGDVHGNFPSVILSVLVHRPAAVIFLGDLQAQRPLEQELAPIIAMTEIWYIHGNHDTDSEADHDNLFLSALAGRNLHGRVVEIAGKRIAGLGGIFRGEVWYPPGDALYDSHAELVRNEVNRPTVKAYRKERERKHKSTIFPDDYFALVGQRADILVTHEAPSCHPNGFAAIDDLASSLRVHTAFHGHQHDRLDYTPHRERVGFSAYGVGFCGITDQDGNVICIGDFDEQNEQRYQQYRQQGRIGV